MTQSKIAQNTIMLYGLNIAKIVFPLLTLPYLTRVLSIELYGVVAYVKATMQYMQLIIDFGFMLSGTKDIVLLRNDKKSLGLVVGDILLARLLLVLISFFILLFMILAIPILNKNILYTILSFIGVALSVFLFDYLFRGIEKMSVITIRFFVMRGFATLLTFFLVKNNDDYLWIPILEIIGSLIAVFLVRREVKKLGLIICFSTIKNAVNKLVESATYFASNMATTAFGALNTLLIGVFLQPTDVAYWSISMQLIGGIQSLYSPITSGIYPEMIKNKNINLIKKVLKFFMPIVFCGCVFSFSVAEYALTVVGGTRYVSAAPTFQLLIPILFFSFPGIVLGWPTLGAIGKAKEVSITTFVTAVFQLVGLLLLACIGRFTLIPLAILRSLTELLLLLLRARYVAKFINNFASISE